MELEAIGGAASIALLGSAVFALTARGWIALNRGRAWRPPFPLLPEAAERFRDEFELLGRKQSALLASALVFAVFFAVAWVIDAARVLAGAGAWLPVATGLISVAGLAWGGYRLHGIVVERRRLALVRYANIAVGQALQKVSGNLNRVFHDVACGNDVIDHVLIGLKGVYAISVIARRARRHNRVRARDGRLWFAPGRDSLPLEEHFATSENLAKLFRKATGNRARVRTVLVVPGWEVEEQAVDKCLVVNERSLGMLRGWTDPDDYLMNEDVEALHEFLEQRSTHT